jgi:hypothetical protein
MGYELVEKPRKKRATKIDMYGLENRVINYIAENRSYAYIAKKLTDYVRHRKKNPDKEFSITGQAVKVWWMENSRQHNEMVNVKRSAIIQQRHCRYLDKGIQIREEVQKGLKSDAKKASQVAETPYEHESVARIREKIVKAQESGEKAVARQSPNLNVTNVIVNPLSEFSKKMQKKLEEIEEKEKNAVDIEYEEIEEEEIDEEDDEIGDDEEDEEE